MARAGELELEDPDWQPGELCRGQEARQCKQSLQVLLKAVPSPVHLLGAVNQPQSGLGFWEENPATAGRIAHREGEAPAVAQRAVVMNYHGKVMGQTEAGFIYVQGI